MNFKVLPRELPKIRWIPGKVMAVFFITALWSTVGFVFLQQSQRHQGGRPVGGAPAGLSLPFQQARHSRHKRKGDFSFPPSLYHVPL